MKGGYPYYGESNYSDEANIVILNYMGKNLKPSGYETLKILFLW